MRKNIYRHKFSSTCPRDKRSISYELEIVSNEMILVEDIIAATKIDQGFHEDIADLLVAALGGVQTLRAHHQKVYIETIRERDCSGRLTKRVQIGSTVYESGVDARLAIAAIAAITR